MSKSDFVQWLIQFNQSSGLPGVLYFLFFIRQWKSLEGVVFYVLLASLTADVGGYFFIHFVFPNSHGISNSWHVLNYFLISWLFLKLIPERKLIISVLFFAFLVGASISFVSFYSFFESNTFVKVFSGISCLILSIISYFQLLKHSGQPLKTSHLFWITTSVFLYSSLTLFTHLFSNYLIFGLEVTKEGFAYVALINLTANISKNFILFYAIVLLAHERKEVSILNAESHD